MRALQILPVYGEVAVAKRLTEGAFRLHGARLCNYPPSVSLAGCHLPMNGED